MDVLALFAHGLAVAAQPMNLLAALAGCVIGTLIGVLPGVGPVAGVAILLPVTYGMSPTGALIMLCAIYYGTMYGGTITSVLMNVPGETASVVTCIDGHQMARQGRAGAALAIAAIGSTIGGLVATVAVALVAAPLSRFSLLFGPPEFFALVLVSFTLLIGLAGDSMAKGVIAALFGLALTLPGLDPLTGIGRLTFDSPSMLNGFGFVPVLMGLFGISEILINVEQRQRGATTSPVHSLWLTRSDWKASGWPMARGSVLGFLIGVVPGLGAATSSFLSYAIEKRVAKDPSRFGQGAIEGVAGPETANNASANAALLPLLTLGIPGSATVAIIMAAFLIHGITPGPFLFKDHPDVAWSLIASMVVASVILLVLNLPLVGLWVRILRLPYPILFSVIMVFTVIGTYSVNGSLFDVAVMFVFSAIGYLLRKFGFPMAPIALTLVLGPQLETSLGQSLVMSEGNFRVFFRSPISTTLILIALATTAYFVLKPFAAKGLQGLRGQDAEV
ncbi:MAG TPA: tripartite tricarboxylate transporter permease [Ramlibacter sp.]|nr:tripartite tricarboxylate transporter permease [Ramlibacter sp.]